MITSVSVAAWPRTEQVGSTPVSAAAASPSYRPSLHPDDRVQRNTRNLTNGRPALATTPSAGPPSAPSTPKATKPKARKKGPKRHQAPKPKVAVIPEPSAAQLRQRKTRFTRVNLNVRRGPADSAPMVTVLSAGSRLTATATTYREWTLIVYRGKGRWVHTAYLSAKKPKPASAASSPGSISGGKCKSGSKVEAGLTRDAVRVHRAICARFPGVTAYGGVRADSLPEHPSGRALDSMVASSSLGHKIANWVRDNHRRLGVSEVIFAAHIWTVQRSSEGWRSMSNRGSVTANHYDHVHVTVYGNAGTG